VTPAAWREQGRKFFHRGHNIFYREDGEGEEAIVCLHGFATGSWDFRRLWPAFRRRYRLIAPDYIGFGFSDKPRAHEYSLLDQADLVETLLQALTVERVHVLAHDYGDSVAQELLARFEARRERGKSGLEIRSICYLNGGLFPEVHRPRLIQKLLLTRLGPALSRLYNERSFHRQMRAVFGPHTQPDYDELHEYWTLLGANEGLALAHRLIRYIRDRRRHRERWVQALRTAAIPIQLINGSMDPVSGAHMVARYRELVSQRDIVELPRIGHYPQVEAPEEVLAHYREFLDAHFPAGENA